MALIRTTSFFLNMAMSLPILHALNHNYLLIGNVDHVMTIERCRSKNVFLVRLRLGLATGIQSDCLIVARFLFSMRVIRLQLYRDKATYFVVKYTWRVTTHSTLCLYGFCNFAWLNVDVCGQKKINKLILENKTSHVRDYWLGIRDWDEKFRQ